MRGAESLEPGSVLGVDRLMTGVRPPAVPRVGHRQAKDESVRNAHQRSTIPAREAVAGLCAARGTDQTDGFGGRRRHLDDADAVEKPAHPSTRPRTAIGPGRRVDAHDHAGDGAPHHGLERHLDACPLIDRDPLPVVLGTWVHPDPVVIRRLGGDRHVAVEDQVHGNRGGRIRVANIGFVGIENREDRVRERRSGRDDRSLESAARHPPHTGHVGGSVVAPRVRRGESDTGFRVDGIRRSRPADQHIHRRGKRPCRRHCRHSLSRWYAPLAG